ncbi:MAG: 50S ribosomal protein L5, partial [Pirellulales bacterium]
MAKKSKSAKDSGSESASGTPRLQELYNVTVRPALAEELSKKNPHAIPQIEKIVINMGVGTAVTEKKHLEEAMAALSQIAGQKPVATLSRKAVSGFKLREDLPIGCKVTLRGRRMYEFLDRLIALALPRVRDFRGLSATS